jgi:hypothetical protein
MFSSYFQQVCRCSLMPVKVEDSRTHVVQHLRDMMEVCKGEGRTQVDVTIAASGSSR